MVQLCRARLAFKNCTQNGHSEFTLKKKEKTPTPYHLSQLICVAFFEGRGRAKLALPPFCCCAANVFVNVTPQKNGSLERQTQIYTL